MSMLVFTLAALSARLANDNRGGFRMSRFFRRHQTNLKTVCPELVEGPFFLSAPQEE
jgi:hypothetical protein